MSFQLSEQVLRENFIDLFIRLDKVIYIEKLCSFLWDLNYYMYFDKTNIQNLENKWLYESIFVNSNILSKLDHKLRPINPKIITRDEIVEITRTFESVLFLYKDYPIFDTMIKRTN